MAHLLEKMAYVGETPWHGLGRQLPERQPIDVWAREAGMDWAIRETPVRYMAGAKESGLCGIYGQPMEIPELKVRYRRDTNAPLAADAGRYALTHPPEGLEV